MVQPYFWPQGQEELMLCARHKKKCFRTKFKYSSCTTMRRENNCQNRPKSVKNSRHITNPAFTYYLNLRVLIANTEFVDEEPNSILARFFQSHEWAFFWSENSIQGKSPFRPSTPCCGRTAVAVRYEVAAPQGTNRHGQGCYPPRNRLLIALGTPESFGSSHDWR